MNRKKLPTLILAPMRGATTNVYRRVYGQFFTGIDLAIAPFIPTVHTDKIKEKLLKDVLPKTNGTLPTVPQFLGKDPEDILTLLRAFVDLGYTEANWNLGCPAPQVTRKKRGSGLLPLPNLIREILDHIYMNIPLTLSIKLRLGKENAEEIFTLLPILNQYPLSEVIIHPRTAKQMYEGTVDLEAFEQCIPITQHSLCYNGDINTPVFFQELQARFPSISRWMLGRGILKNPFLPALIKHPTDVPTSNKEQQEIIYHFHHKLFEEYKEALYNEDALLGKMKEFWTYLSQSFDDPHRVFKYIKKAQNTPHYQDAVNKVFEKNQWAPPDDT